MNNKKSYLSEKCFSDAVFELLPRKIIVIEILDKYGFEYEYQLIEYIDNVAMVLDEISGIPMYPLSSKDSSHFLIRGEFNYCKNTKRNRLSAVRAAVKRRDRCKRKKTYV